MSPAFSAASCAANLACVLHLLRHTPDQREEVAGALAVLIGMLDGRRLVVHVEGETLTLNGTPVGADAPGVAHLRGLLTEHDIGELETPGEERVLTPLLRTLAVRREFFQTLHDLLDHLDPDTRGAVRLDPPTPIDAETLHETVYADLAAPLPVAAAAAPAAAGMAGTSVTSGVEEDRRSLRDVKRVTEALDAADGRATPDAALLNDAVSLADLAAELEDWDHMVTLTAAVVRAEQRAAGEQERRPYAIALRRMLPRSVLERLARLAGVGKQRDALLQVFQRMGVDATEVLLARLIDAESIDERRNYYTVLRQTTDGSALLVNMLTHDVWYVVRNVADLCGDLRVEEAVPELARRLDHPDERVRRSIAGALAKIGTPTATEPLRTALHDASPAVRLHAATLLQGRVHRALAMTLAVRADEESHPEVLRELLLALGRIGTPEALQALVRIAEPGGRVFNRKSGATRLAAVEAMGLVGTPPAVDALRRLAEDTDRDVRTAAARAAAAAGS